MHLAQIARPPNDAGVLPGEIHHVLAGAAAGLQHVAGLAAQELFQHRPDRDMVAVKGRRVEPPVGLARSAIPAEFGDKLRQRFDLSRSALARGVARCKNSVPVHATPRKSGYSRPASQPINLLPP